MPWTRGEIQGFKRLRRVPDSRLSVLPPVKTARRTSAVRSSLNILLCFQPSETVRGSQEIEFSRRQELGAKGP